MSTLENIKKLRILYPNDQEFGAMVSKYLDENKTCCDDPINHVRTEIVDEGPYGYYGYEITCKVCGKEIETKIF
jgi:hypothetical protein